MTTPGKTMSSSTKIPVGEMAKDMLGDIFPHLTKEQIEAMKAGKPIPPSPNWEGSRVLQVTPESEDAHVRQLQQARIEDQRRIEELNKKIEEINTTLRAKMRLEGLLEHFVAAMAGGPLVSCMMMFGAKDRMRRARKAVNQFVSQSYPNKQLIIVNNTETPVTNVPHKEIKEVRMEISSENPSESLGCMRNFGLSLCDGTLVYPHWDDDDVYDRHLLAFLVQNFMAKNYGVEPVNQKAVTLGSELRIDIKNSVVYEHIDPEGIPGNMLVPARGSNRYADQHGDEGIAFWNRYWAIKSHVCASAYPLNTLKMSVYDGNNVTPIEKFMVDHSSPEHEGRWQLGLAEMEHMRAVLAGFGVQAEARQPAPVTAPMLPVG